MRAQVTQTGVSFNMRKNAAPENQFAIRVSEQTMTWYNEQVEQTEKLAAEKRESMLGAEVKAIVSQESSFAPNPATE